MSLGIIQVIESIDLQAKEAVEKLSPKGLNKKYYRLNKSFVLYSELSGLFSKSHLLLEKELLTELRQLGQVHYLALTGFYRPQQYGYGYVDCWHRKQRVFGAVNSQIPEKLGREINYTVMPLKEFQYRRDITDRFLYDILVHPKIVVVDQVGVNQ